MKENQNSKQRTRSPSYPAISLEEAIQKVDILWKKVGRHDVAIEIAVEYWDYNPKSSGGYSAVSALKQFGLLTDEGRGKNRQIKLTDDAIKLVFNPDKDSEEYREIIKKSALNPRLYSELWEKYNGILPDDAVIARYLVVDRAFNKKYIDNLIKDFKLTIELANLSEKDKLLESDSGEYKSSSKENLKQDDEHRPTYSKKKELAKYQVPLGKNEATLTFTGESLELEDFEDLKKYVDLFKKQFERKQKEVQKTFEQ